MRQIGWSSSPAIKKGKQNSTVMNNVQLDFRDILADYQDKVYNQAFRMLGNREEAEEATQDIFIKVHRSLAEFRGDCKFSSWIYRITANVCISRMRKKQLRITSIDEPLREEGITVAELVADEQADPEQDYSSKEMGEIIRNEVRRLPALWAQALSLHYFGGQSYEEVAEVMEIPRPTVATYISRGKKQLAKQLVALTGKQSLSF